MRQVAVISGKGGTGKTSLLLAFARMAHNIVLADCDVDASNLPVTLRPTPISHEDIFGAYKARIDAVSCTGCGACVETCRFSAITTDYSVMPLRCEGCGVCDFVCPSKAVSLYPIVSGTLHTAETDAGVLVYMDMIPGEEGTGKLVTAVRKHASDIAKERDASLVLIDGSPGIGCPVIATIGAVDMALVVTEPSLSGMGDLHRILELCKSMHIPCCVCINRFDINTAITDKIRAYCTSEGITMIGEVPYNPDLAQSIELGEDTPPEASADWAKIVKMWEQLCSLVGLDEW